MSATLVQISDCHLFEEEGEIPGVKCAHAFEHVCGWIRTREGAADLLLATGDISHDGSQASCLRFEAGARETAMDSAPPGYRRLELHADGRFDTTVVRCGDTG